jgi:cobalamin biosynthesis Mg chelatase CobN
MISDNLTTKAKENGNYSNNRDANSIVSRAEYFMTLHKELDRLEEMLLESGPRIMGHTVIDEERVCRQIDQVRLSVPDSIAKAEEILQYKQEIMTEAEQYADEIVKAAEIRATKLVEESGILRQAELEANQLRRHTQEDCDELRTQTMNELNQQRRQAQKEIESIRQHVMAEVTDLQRGADEYCDRILANLEGDLVNAIKIVQNGRQELRH